MKPTSDLHDLHLAQVGLTAALRRAFIVPEDDSGQRFEELLRKLC